MAEQAGAGQAGGGSPAAGAPAPDGGGNPGGTPSPGAADAANTGGKTYSETAFKEVVGQRDALKKELGELRQQVEAFTSSEKKRQEDEAAKRGEHQKLAEDRARERDEALAKAKQAEESANARIAEYVAKQQRSMAMAHLETAYKAVGGHDAETFSMLAEKALKDGKITVDGDFKVAGVEAFVSDLQKGKPHLFKGGGASGGSSGGGSLPGGMGAGAPPNDINKILAGRRGNFGDGPALTAEQRKAALQQLEESRRRR